MAIAGTKREFKEGGFTKKIGIFTGTVKAINPDKDELDKLYEGRENKEVDYLGETKDGDTKLSVRFYVEADNTLFPVTVTLVNKPRESKKPEDAPADWKGKKQYINLSGACTWADDEKNLPDWFKKRTYRAANVGEEELYSFLRGWLNQLDWNTNEELLDFKKLMRGNVKELTDLMKSEFVGEVLALATIHIAETEEGPKEYQQVYNRSFLPGPYKKYFTIKSTKKPKAVDWFIKGITDETYGCKDIYDLEPLHDYNPDEHVVAGNKVISSDGADY